SPHDLRARVEESIGYSRELEIFITSFGFKYGVPHDAELVIDVRFLPNPHFVEKLSAKTGHEEEVKDFILQHQVSNQFIEHYSTLLEFLMPHYINEGKH